MPKETETFLTVSLLGLAIYFSVLLIRGLHGYLRFRRLWPTALLTWPVPRPAYFTFVLVLGVLNVFLAVITAWLGRPFHHVYAIAVMAVYFVCMVPLAARIHLGLYRDGVWADTGFLPYAQVARMKFFEEPELVLILLSRERSRSFRLPVPRDEYGAVRKILEEMIRARVLNMDGAILAL